MRDLTNGDIVSALRDMPIGKFRETIARARPPEDLAAVRKAVAADAVQHLVRRGDSTIRAALDSADAAERKAAARALLHGHALGDPEAAERRKAEAVTNLADYQHNSLGRGAGYRITPGTAASHRDNALDSIAATGLPVSYDDGAGNY